MVIDRWHQFSLSFQKPFIHVAGKGGSLGRIAQRLESVTKQSLSPCPDPIPYTFYVFLKNQ